MEWLNYHHLLYFWVVAKEGGLTRAGRVLGVSHPTLSAQIHALEDQLGEKLFAKAGRNLALTEVGRHVFRYADEIFSLGREMLDTVKSHAHKGPLRLHVGIVDVVPKLLIRRVLAPVLRLKEPVLLVCREGNQEGLLSALMQHSLDVVISDAPIPSGSQARAFNHLLGETGLTFFAAPSLARAYERGFPKSLHGAPWLLPLKGLSLRRSLDLFFERKEIVPRIVAEFEDSALLKVFGADGAGLFVAPTVVEDEVRRQYGVDVIGRTDEVREAFYAITAERRLKNPAQIALATLSRSDVFAASPTPPRGAGGGT